MRAQEIFVEEIPIIGKVPMCFFIPDSPEHSELSKLIQNYGGKVTRMHECFTYQIQPLEHKPKEAAYFSGKVYKAHWLVDSIQEQSLLDCSNYLAFEKSTEQVGGLKIEFTKGNTLYTITEAIKIFDLALANPQIARGANFWNQVEKNGIIPNRTSDSMRSFWKEKSNSGLVNYLQLAIKNRAWYCHAFSEIPQVCVGQSNSAVEERVFESARNANTNQVHQQTINQHSDKSGLKLGVPSYMIDGVVVTTSNNLNQTFSRMEKIHPYQQKQQQEDELMIESCHTDKMVDQLEKQHIVVREEQTGTAISLNNGKDAFFAMIAQDMLQIAQKYSKDIDEVHAIFYQVSCNRDKLIKHLSGDKGVILWKELEDLALKSNDQMYQFVLKQYGEKEVVERKRFLEINK